MTVPVLENIVRQHAEQAAFLWTVYDLALLEPNENEEMDEEKVLLIENAGGFATAKQWWWLLNLVDHPRVGLVWNAANAAAAGEPASVSVPIREVLIRAVYSGASALLVLGGILSPPEPQRVEPSSLLPCSWPSCSGAWSPASSPTCAG